MTHASSRQDLIFIYANLHGLDTLLSGLPADSDVELLDGTQDGLVQITRALQGRNGLNAIHVLSHGSAGAVQLGALTLSNDNLQEHTLALAQVGAALAEDGDLLLYGCEVAQGVAGLAFVRALADAVGAHVSAASHKVGAAALGAHWTLDVAPALNSPSLVLNDWPGVLVVPSTPNPFISGKDLMTVNEGVATTINGFTVGEFDANDSVTVKVEAAHGMLSLGTSVDITGYANAAITLQFSGTVAAVNTALNSLSYLSDANFIGTDALNVAVSDDSGNTWAPYTWRVPGKFYNPANGHYYERVTASREWADAKTAAEGQTLQGLNGYLATITSAEEQAFIQTHYVQGTSVSYRFWIGGSDATTEGDWKWVTGPEGEANSGAGTLFWRGTALGVLQNDLYQKWNINQPSDTYEPADFLQFELDFDFDTPRVGWANSSTYPSNYLVEYGGIGTESLTTAPLTLTVLAAPVLTGVRAAVTFLENTLNTTAQILDDDVALVNSAMPPDATFNGGSLAVSFAANSGSAQDVLTIKAGGGITLLGQTVSYNGFVIGSFNASGAGSGLGGNTLVINFNTTDATVAAVDALIQTVAYQTTSDAPAATRTLTLQATYAGGGFAASTIEIAVTPENDAPVLLPPAVVGDFTDGFALLTSNQAAGSSGVYTSSSINESGDYYGRYINPLTADGHSVMTESVARIDFVTAQTSARLSFVNPMNAALGADYYGYEDYTSPYRTVTFLGAGDVELARFSTTSNDVTTSDFQNQLSQGVSSLSLAQWAALYQVSYTAVAGHEIKAITIDSTYYYSQFAIDTLELGLRETSAILTPIAEDVLSESNAGNTIASLIATGRITDGDLSTAAPKAIAVSAVDNTDGTWQFQAGSGAWTAFDFNANLGKALLLAGTDGVRFVPNANFNGSVANGITFHAWDQSTGSAGAYLTVEGNQGGSGALSLATSTAGITVTPMDEPANTAPIISGVPDAMQAVTTGIPSALADFTVADTEQGATSLSVTLTATNGTVNGLTDANLNTAGIQLTGTAASINTALASATFTATLAGAASIGISASDGIADAVVGTYNLNADGFTFAAGTPIYTESGTAVPLASTGTLAYAVKDSLSNGAGNYNGTSLQASALSDLSTEMTAITARATEIGDEGFSVIAYPIIFTELVTHELTVNTTGKSFGYDAQAQTLYQTIDGAQQVFASVLWGTSDVFDVFQNTESTFYNDVDDFSGSFGQLVTKMAIRVSFTSDLATTALVNEVLQSLSYSNTQKAMLPSATVTWTLKEENLTTTNEANDFTRLLTGGTLVTLDPVNDAPRLTPILNSLSHEQFIDFADQTFLQAAAQTGLYTSIGTKVMTGLPDGDTTYGALSSWLPFMSEQAGVLVGDLSFFDPEVQSEFSTITFDAPQTSVTLEFFNIFKALATLSPAELTEQGDLTSAVFLGGLPHRTVSYFNAEGDLLGSNSVTRVDAPASDLMTELISGQSMDNFSGLAAWESLYTDRFTAPDGQSVASVKIESYTTLLGQAIPNSGGRFPLLLDRILFGEVTQPQLNLPVFEAGLASEFVVGDMFGVGTIRDADTYSWASVPKSVAVSAVDNSQGSWAYQNGTDDWAAFDFAGDHIGKAVLLDATYSIRFTPGQNFNGTLSNAITFYAWDKTTGNAGEYLTLTGNTGGVKTLSAQPFIASVSAPVINHAPTITNLPIAAQGVTVGAAAALADFTVADTEQGATSLSVTLTATNGTVNGLTDANLNTAGIQLTGTAASINTALASATFTATIAGAASIGISVSDGVAPPTTDTYNLTASAAPVPDPVPAPTPAPAPAPEPVPTPTPVTGTNGIAAPIENAVPGLITSTGQPAAVGDGNGDGLQDSTQVQVASLSFLQTPTVSTPGTAASTFVSLVAGSQDGKVTSSSNTNASLANVVQKDAPANLPVDLKMPLGLIAFTATVGLSTPSTTGNAGTPAVGVSETFSLYVDPSLAVNGYWKQNTAGTWVNLASSAYGGKIVSEGGKTRLDFQLTDGGQFDADGKIDGIITDPGAAASMPLSLVGYAPTLADGTHFWF